MPYLNWKEQNLRQEIAPHPQRESQLTLALSRAQLEELVPRLDETFLHGAGELRLDLPRGWIVFWKLRESESRLLLAHPEKEEWVATVALDPAHALLLSEALHALSTGSLEVSRVAPVGRVSNVEIVISVA